MKADWLIFDFETLNDTPWEATVLSLAYIAGTWDSLDIDTDMGKLLASGEELFFKIKNQADYGRTTSKETIEWWRNQSQEAQDRVFKPEVKIDITELFPRFNAYCKRMGVDKDTKVMLRGPYFDHAIMASLGKRLFAELPYNHWNIRDIRTVLDTIVGYPSIFKISEYFEKKHQLVKHSALHDCAKDIMQTAFALKVGSEVLKKDYAQYGFTLYGKW